MSQANAASPLNSGREPVQSEGYDFLVELPLNLRWSCNHATDEVWRTLDARLWDLTHNPSVVLQTASRDRIESALADLSTVRVELYANDGQGGAPLRQEMKRVRALADMAGGYDYSVAVPDSRSAADFTVRLIPYFDGAAIPLEEARILWQR